MKNHTRPRSLIAIALIACCAGLTAVANTKTIENPTAQTPVATPADNAKMTIAVDSLKEPAIEGLFVTDQTATLDGLTVRLCWTELTDQSVINGRIENAGYQRATIEQMNKAFGAGIKPKAPGQHPLGIIQKTTNIASASGQTTTGS